MKYKLILLVSIVEIYFMFIGQVLAKSSRNLLVENSETKKVTESEILISQIVTIREFKILGNTIYSTSTLQKSLAPYLGQRIVPRVLSNMGEMVTNLYHENGYNSSFATVSAFEIKNGIVTIKITEGRINKINVTVNGYLRSEYVRSRLSRNLINRIYNQSEIERTILTLQEVDPNIERLEVLADIDPSDPALVFLNVIAKAAPALSFTAITANKGSPAFGEVNTAFQLDSRLLGNGDRLSGLYVVSEGNEGFTFRYSTPLNAENTQVFGAYSQNTGKIVEKSLKFC